MNTIKGNEATKNTKPIGIYHWSKVVVVNVPKGNYCLSSKYGQCFFLSGGYEQQKDWRCVNNNYCCKIFDSFKINRTRCPEEAATIEKPADCRRARVYKP